MGVVCLQGGGEMQPPCAELDRHLLSLAPGPRAVVVPLAGAPGREYALAGATGVRHYTGLGADAVVAPDARSDEPGALAAMAAADLLVLPGGSPSRLLRALVGTPAGEAVLAAVARGAVVTGASAGAMLLCARTLLPDEGLRMADGLGVVPGFVVVPHWSGPRPAWVEAARRGAPDADVLGLPECSGVVVDGEAVYAVGQAAPVLITDEGESTLALG